MRVTMETFSTMILGVVATCAINRAALSRYIRLAAWPEPTPAAFVGVPTACKTNTPMGERKAAHQQTTKTMSASRTDFSMSVVKKRFFPIVSRTSAYNKY